MHGVVVVLGYLITLRCLRTAIPKIGKDYEEDKQHHPTAFRDDNKQLSACQPQCTCACTCIHDNILSHPPIASFIAVRTT